MPPPAIAPIGINCKTFVDLTGCSTTPVWTVIDDISDESLNITHDETTFDRRASKVGETEPTITRMELTLSVLKDPADTVYQGLETALLSKTALEFLVLSAGAKSHSANGTIDLANTANGTCGHRFYGKLFGWSEGRNLSDATFNATTVKPCLGSNPQTAEISDGNITYTAW